LETGSRFGHDAAVERLITAGVLAGLTIHAHYAWRNPQLEHRRPFQVMQHPVTGATRYQAYQRRSQPGTGTCIAAATLGQHNDEILGGELGLSADDSPTARAQIIGERPSFM
jgi:crotonobetainyl-CoA:carnitine CoA-transferase CaiB-like acyl-CoA transferase